MTTTKTSTKRETQTKLSELLEARRARRVEATKDRGVNDPDTRRLWSIDAIEADIASTAEAFVRNAEWLARKLTEAADRVRKCEAFEDAGHQACEARGSSLFQDVQVLSAKLDTLSQIQKGVCSYLDPQAK